MSKFIFRLELTLKLRVTERDARRIELADALARANHVQRQIDTIDEELQAMMYARPLGAGLVDIGRLLATERYCAALRENRVACERQRLQVTEEVARRREALMSADRDVRTLEKLRERQLASYQAQAQRREQRELDEIGARISVPEGEL